MIENVKPAIYAYLYTSLGIHHLSERGRNVLMRNAHMFV